MEKTIIIAHPKIGESTVQSFLLEGLDTLKVETEIIQLDHMIVTNKLDIHEQQKIILNSSELLLQFPLYWYSAPASLAIWQERVFTDQFMRELQEKNKTKATRLSLVVSFSDKKSDFGAGAKIGRTLSEILSPYQAFADKLGFVFRRPFLIDQFNYQTPANKQRLLVDYLLYVSGVDESFSAKSKWLLKQLVLMEQTEEITLLVEFLERQIAEYEQLDSELLEIKNDHK